VKEIPNYLDDPQQILFWEFDEFILLAIMFGIGIMVNLLGTLVLLGFIGIKYYRKLKDRQAAGFLLHVVYWHTGIGSYEAAPTSRPIPFIRRIF